MTAGTKRMRRLFFDHALLPGGWGKSVGCDIEGGVIRAIAPGMRAEGRERIAGIALPGLGNLHSHTFQRAMAGLAETRGPAGDDFWTWRQLMYRFLGNLTPEDVEAFAAQAFAEMLEGGFTAVAEFHYLHHDRDGTPYADLAELAARIAAAAAETGIGLTLLPSFYAAGNFGGAAPEAAQRRFLNGPARFLKLAEGARKAVEPLADAVVGIAPHSLRAVTPEALRDIVAATPAGPIHIHAAEQMKEVEDCVAWSGKPPVAWLLENAGVDRRWCLVHATHMTEAETRELARSGAVAGLCPITEASLGDGTFEGVRFGGAGGLYGVGSDCNIEITAPGELKLLEYSQRLAHRSRNAMALREGESTGRILYETALAGGARALGRRVGALAVDHRADFVVLDGTHIDLAASANDRWLDSYIFVAGKGAIDRVTVGGEDVVTGGRHRARGRISARYARSLARLAAA